MEKKVGVIYLPVYTNNSTSEKVAPVDTYVISGSIYYDEFNGMKFATVHTVTDGKTTEMVYDDGVRATLKLGDNKIVTSRNIDLSGIYVEGTVVLNGSATASFKSGTANIAAGTSNASGPTVVLDLTNHGTGLVATGISQVNYEVVYDSANLNLRVDNDSLYLETPGSDSGSNTPLIAIILAVLVAVLLLGVTFASLRRGSAA